MYTLIAENQYSEQLELTHNAAYIITDIDGIDPPDAVINTTHNAGTDGSEYNSAYVNNRQITITLVVNSPAESNRIALYKYFKVKYPVTLYYSNKTRDVYIKGYTQNVSVGYFDKKQTVQIVIVCPKPYFNGVTDSVQEIDTVESLFEFEFEVPVSKNLLENTAETTTTNGITFTVNSDGTVNVDGTATANAYLVVGEVNLTADTSYILNGCPSGGGNSTYRLYWQGVSGVYDEGSGCTYTPTADEIINIRIVVYSGATVDDLTFEPMVRLATETDDSYVSYNDFGIEFSSISIDSEKDIINYGDVATGVIITIQAIGAVDTPKIYNAALDYFILNTTLESGDVVTINTKQGEKAVTLVRSGVTSNLIGSLEDGSTWFILDPGDNVFTIDAESLPENMLVTFTVTDQYEGV